MPKLTLNRKPLKAMKAAFYRTRTDRVIPQPEHESKIPMFAMPIISDSTVVEIRRPYGN